MLVITWLRCHYFFLFVYFLFFKWVGLLKAKPSLLKATPIGVTSTFGKLCRTHFTGKVVSLTTKPWWMARQKSSCILRQHSKHCFLKSNIISPLEALSVCQLILWSRILHGSHLIISLCLSFVTKQMYIFPVLSAIKYIRVVIKNVI